MTFEELVNDIAERLNISSADSKARIARRLNEVYRRVTSDVGLSQTRRTTVSANSTIGQSWLTFPLIEKIERVYRLSGSRQIRIEEVTMDELALLPPVSGFPTRFAIKATGNNSVTIELNTTPASVFTLYAQGLASLNTLSDNESPVIPESFQDVLIYGTLSEEYRRMEKTDLMQETKAEFLRRLAELKMFLAKSAYLDSYPGKLRIRFGWWDAGVERYRYGG